MSYFLKPERDPKEITMATIPAAPMPPAPTAPPQAQGTPGTPPMPTAPGIPAAPAAQAQAADPSLTQAAPPEAVQAAQAQAPIPAAPTAMPPAAPTAMPQAQAAPTAPAMPASQVVLDEPPAYAVVSTLADASAQAVAVVKEKPNLPVGPDGFPTSGTLAEIASFMGFEDINFDVYGVIPNITLSNGNFWLEGQDIGTEFLCRMGVSRKKYLLAFGPNEDKKLFYSYNLQTCANTGRHVSEFMTEAQQAGQQVKQSEYYEISAIMEGTGSPVNLSVPVAGSGANVARFIADCFARRLRPNSVLVKVYKAPLVTGVKFPFTPWGFEIVG